MNLDVYRRILATEVMTYVLHPRALWRLSGPDSARYLNGQVTTDITKLAEGQTAYAAVCTAKGRMEGDVCIARHGGDFYLDAAAVLHETLGLRLEKYLIADDAVFEDLADLWSLSHVFGSTPPQIPETAFSVRRSRYGVPGHDVWNASPSAVVVGDVVGSDVTESLRLEHGIPAWDAELTPTTLPPEAGPRMLQAISYTKGCYVGQETIARLKSVGHVNRTLVFLRSESQAFPAPTARLMQGEREVGIVTSSGFSPTMGCGIALAYVQRALADPGGQVDAAGLKLTVTATPLPGAA